MRSLVLIVFTASVVHALQLPFLSRLEASTTPPHAAHPPPSSSTSNWIFSSLTSLLGQLGNTVNPNGHAVVLGSVPPGTLLFHARKDAKLPSSPEWVAFDAEMSWGIMGGRGGNTSLLTYATTRDLRLMYLDGNSASLGDTGWLDSQAVLIYGQVNSSSWNWVGGEYDRARNLCQLGKSWGFEAIVRMNTGYEAIICDFESDGIELISHLNLTDPYSPSGIGFPAPPDSPDFVKNLDLASARLDGPPDFPGGRRPPWGNGTRPGRGPGNRDWKWVPSPFASKASIEWIRSAVWHYNSPPESRVKLDYSTFMTFFDPAYKSLIASRNATVGNFAAAKKQARLTAISKADAKAFLSKAKLVTRQKAERGWGPSASGIDWAALARTIEERFSGRIGHSRALLQGNQTELATHRNSSQTALDLRTVFFGTLMPFIDLADYSNTSTTWIHPAEARCAAAYTSGKALHQSRLAEPERLLKGAIEGVMARLCSDFTSAFADIQALGLPVTIAPGFYLDEDEDAALERRSKAAIAPLRERFESLWDWLGWLDPTDDLCSGRCKADQMCVVKTWPVGMFLPDAFSDEAFEEGPPKPPQPPRRGPPGWGVIGDPDGRCVSAVSLEFVLEV